MSEPPRQPGAAAGRPGRHVSPDTSAAPSSARSPVPPSSGAVSHEAHAAEPRYTGPPHRQPADPATRGQLSISNAAVAHLVEAAAAEVDGVLGKQSTGMLRSEGGVRANVLVDHNRAKLRLSLALSYPAPVPVVLARVRSQVTERLRTLADMQVTGFDIGVTQLVGAHEQSRRVVE